MALRRLLLAISWLAFAAGSGSAEPVSIAAGVATTDVPAESASGDFNLVDTNGHVIVVHWPQSNFFTSLTSLCQFGCAPGTVVSPDGHTIANPPPTPGEPSLSPSGSVDGNAILFRGGPLSFTGPAVALPAVAPPELDVFTLNLPFTFGGLLTGYQFSGRDAVLVFSGDLSGAGTAHLEFRGAPFGEFMYRRTIYEFEPTPEPATVTTALIAGGLAALRSRLRRRRQQARDSRLFSTLTMRRRMSQCCCG